MNVNATNKPRSKKVFSLDSSDLLSCPTSSCHQSSHLENLFTCVRLMPINAANEMERFWNGQ